MILELRKSSLTLLPIFPHLFAIKWWDQLPWSWFLECWVLCQLFHSLLSPSSRCCLVPLHIWGCWYFSQQSWFHLVHHTMFFAYKLNNKQGDDIQPWCTPFPIWNQFILPCPVLTVSSWPAYKFLRRQVRWSGIPISWRIFHTLLWSTQWKALM